VTQPYSIVLPVRERSDSPPLELELKDGCSIALSAYTPEEYFRAHPAAQYWMTGRTDGVTFHSRVNPALDRFISLEEIREAVPDFRLSPHRTLERHLFKLWD
jgi:hypothetical protein